MKSKRPDFRASACAVVAARRAIGSRPAILSALLLVGSGVTATAQVSPNGPEFQVNAYTTSSQERPAISAASGVFIVVWQSWGSDGTDTDADSIQGRRFAADGAPLGAQFQVNTYTTGGQAGPVVAASAAGDFVVVWESPGSYGTDTGSPSIQGQRFGADGAPLGGQFQINTYTTGQQHSPAVAAGSAGDFVVVWVSYGSGGTDTSSWSVQGQRYDVDGNPAGGQFQVNTYTTGSQTRPCVASSAAGDFVVVWESEGSYGSDTSSTSIQAQRYDSAGSPLGSELQVNSYTSSYQILAAVAANAAGDFVVAWTSVGSDGSDYDGRSVQGQRFADDGTPLGAQFQVNSYTTGYQYYPVVTSDPSGNFVVAWEGYGSFGTDTDSTSIHGQRFDGLFRDGAESGDTSRWSSTVP